MNYRSLVLAIAALSFMPITTATAQTVYVAPGGVYIGGGPVYVIPAPGNGNGNYVEPIVGHGNGYGYRNGYENENGYENGNGDENRVPGSAAYLPTVVAPVGAIVPALSGLNGNGYGYGYRNGYGPRPQVYYRNGYGPPRLPRYYNGHPLLSTYASTRVPRPLAATHGAVRNGNAAQSSLNRPGGLHVAKQNGASEFKRLGQANRRGLDSAQSAKTSALSAAPLSLNPAGGGRR